MKYDSGSFPAGDFEPENIARLENRKVHIRKRPDAPGIEPVYCGKNLVASVTEAWGYWGPTGDGWDDICKECVEKYREAKK